MSKLNALIAGSTGYIGIQLVKLLTKHPNINIKYLCGNTSVGKSINYFDKSIKNKNLPKIIKFNNKLLNDVDIVFTALPNSEAQKISNLLLPKNYLIDLSADFRLRKAKDYHFITTGITAQIALSACDELLKKYKINCGVVHFSTIKPLDELILRNLITSSKKIITLEENVQTGGFGSSVLEFS